MKPIANYPLLRRLTLAAALLPLLAGAKERVTDVPDYSSLTYVWNDNAGTPRTSTLAETATDPAQILAFVKAVYENPSLPGTWYRDGSVRADKATTGWNNKYDNTVNYRSVTRGGWSVTGKDPNNDGMTAILVELHDDWDWSDYQKNIFKHDGGRAYSSDQAAYALVSEAYKSVRLIGRQRYFTAEESSKYGPGFLLSIHEDLNRFFIMTKGSAMREKDGTTWEYSNFPYGTFEEISASSTATGSTVIDGVYSKLADGATFPVQHICAGILEQEHYIAMDGIDGKDTFPVELMFFIPDYRSKGQYRVSGYRFNNYNSDYLPRMLDQTVRLNVSVERAPEWTDDNVTNDKKQVDVTLTWTDALINGMELKFNTTYYIYEVIDGVKQQQPVAQVSNTLTWSYRTSLSDVSRSVYYVVEARPEEGMYGSMDSNIDSGVIPSVNDMEKLELAISGTSTGDFDYATDTNTYRQQVALSASTVYPIKNVHLKKGDNEFRLTRDGNHIATVVIDRGDYTKNGQSYTAKYTYTVKDAAGNGLVTTKEFFTYTGSSKNEPSYTIGNLSDILIPDTFSAATADELATDYEYRMTYQNGAQTYVSNALVFHTYASDLQVGYDRIYSYNQISAEPQSWDAAADSRLEPTTGIRARVKIYDSPAVSFYELRTANLNNVARIYRTATTYELFTADDNGNFTVRDDSAVLEHDADGQTWLAFTYTPRSVADTELHVVVVTPRQGDAAQAYNTYGTLRHPVPVFPTVDFDISYAQWTDTGWHIQVSTDPHWTVDTGETLHVQGQNVWRRANDVDVQNNRIVTFDMPLDPDLDKTSGNSTAWTTEDEFGEWALDDRYMQPRSMGMTVAADYTLRVYLFQDGLAMLAADDDEPRYIIVERAASVTATTQPNITTSIDSVVGDDSAIAVSAGRGTVTVTGYTGTVELYNAQGQLVATHHATGNDTWEAPAGILIVSAGNYTAKVNVK